MSSPDQLIRQFSGGDPIAGAQALLELVALGDAGEEALFSRPIQFPKTVQVRRRWLRYVASREKTVVDRLLDRMKNQDRFTDAYTAAFLFAGIGKNREAVNALYQQLEAAMQRSYDQASSCFVAWGFAGGDAGTLWHHMRDNWSRWSALKTFAFRGACASAARMNAGDLYTIEQLITRFVEIDDQPDDVLSDGAIRDSELSGESIDVFMAWRRGEVADRILRDWSRHDHWRVRYLGARILSNLGFQRPTKAVGEWLRRESIQALRIPLLHALERSQTTLGADILIEQFNDNQEERRYGSQVAWRASDTNRALEVLKKIAADGDHAAAEALVSLARLGYRSEKLSEMLDSHSEYHRINAALATAYLEDAKSLARLVAMQREAATPFERIYLAAASAMLGKQNGAAELNEELVAAASLEDFWQRVDLFFVHRYLQTAVLDALAIGSPQDRELLNAWRAEMEPLDPIPQPVALAVPKPAKASVRQPSKRGSPREEQAPPDISAARPLNVFISYSHQDDRMRKKLGEHLAPLVDDGLIRIWHDREIEAGADWEGEINHEISEADIILLLVSAPFLNSRYCRRELMRALEQRSAGKAVPIPILLRPCDWTSVFNRGDYKAQALPRDDRPVAGGRWPNQDAAFAVIAKELRTKIERMRERSKAGKVQDV